VLCREETEHAQEWEGVWAEAVEIVKEQVLVGIVSVQIAEKECRINRAAPVMK